MGIVNKTQHLPKPFQNPSITLSDGGARKHWVSVPVEKILAGDIVRGFGLVIEVQSSESEFVLDGDVRFKIFFQNGKTERYIAGDTVIAFTEAEGEPVG